MPTTVRSYSKINLGLAIGAPRPDGFHSLATLYQTLALHDLVTVVARPAPKTGIVLRSNDFRVPTDARNTAWSMVEKTLAALGVQAEVRIQIQKNLPIQGGMGAGSANAAAALIALERELGLTLPQPTRLKLAAEVGSDVPLFLVGGSVLGSDRGQVVEPMPDVTLDGRSEIACVIALPRIGVSTPQAFRDWDRLLAAVPDRDLHNLAIPATIEQLSRTYASVLGELNGLRFNARAKSRSGASGIFPDPVLGQALDNPEKLQGLSCEQHHSDLLLLPRKDESGIENDLAENSLLALVHTGIENDFETVVFPQYPLLREIKRLLIGPSFVEELSDEFEENPASANAAVIAALSGSGSALFGLYRSPADAAAAQHRLQQNGVEAIVTTTMPRALYWKEMFAE